MKMIKNYSYENAYSSYSEMLTSLQRHNGKAAAFLINKDSQNGKICTITYMDFYNDICKFGAVLKSENIAGNIAVIGPNSYEWCITYFSISIYDSIPVIIDKDLDLTSMSIQIKQGLCSHVFISKAYNPKKVEKLKTLLPDIKFHILDDILTTINDISFNYSLPQNCKIKPYTIFFTSGTSEKSKAVLVSDSGLCNAAWRGQNSYKMNCGDKSYLFLPLSHIFGFVAGLLWVLSAGGTVCIAKGISSFTTDLKLFNPDICCMVPSIIKLTSGMLMRDDKFCGNNLKLIVSGGASGDININKFMLSHGIWVLEGYGLTETCSGLAMESHPLSGLKPCINVDFKIEDSTNEILVKCDSPMIKYLNNEEASSAAFTSDGYFHTGDTGTIKDGIIKITGRIKDIIVLSNGEKINPIEIEDNLKSIEGIKDAAVIMKNDNIGCYIVPDDVSLNEEYFNNKINEYNKGKPYSHQLTFVNIKNSPFERNAKGDLKRYLL